MKQHEPKCGQEAFLSRENAGARKRVSCTRVAAILETEERWWRELLSPEVRARLEAMEKMGYKAEP